MREEGDGDFLHDSLDFGSSGAGRKIAAAAIGLMPNDAHVELIFWTRGDIITYLELEPFAGALRPIRMPILESIRPYPADAVGRDEDDAAEHDNGPTTR